MWLIDVEDSFEQSYGWVAQAGITLPVLLDRDSTAYRGYAGSEGGFTYAPYPLHVVVDGDGVITYLSVNSNPEFVRDAVEAALDRLGD